MIKAIGPIDQTSRAEVKFGRMEITGRRIDAQREDSSGGRDSFGRANGGGIEHQLRQEFRTVPRQSISCFAFEYFESRNLWSRRVDRQIHDPNAFIMPKRIGHIGPIEIVLSSLQRLWTMLRQFMIFEPSHAARFLRSPYAQTRHCGNR